MVRKKTANFIVVATPRTRLSDGGSVTSFHETHKEAVNRMVALARATARDPVTETTSARYSGISIYKVTPI